jgi:coproporphyrinogen III oxidase-like Fe-S oxidoreductase
MNRNYTAAVIQELAAHHIHHHAPAPTARNNGTTRHHQQQKQMKIALSSIYFGGGTPSLAPIETFREIFHFLHSADSPFLPSPPTTTNATTGSTGDNSKALEITIEMDPGTFSREKLQALKDLGFNRISLGIQSFDNEILERLGRVHRLVDIEASLAILLDVYGPDDVNYSIDLISGVPGLSLAGWIETLQMATNLHPQPSHMSLYDLTIESGTVFGNWYDDKTKGTSSLSLFRSTKGDAPTNGNITLRAPLPSEEESAFQYSFAAGYLRSKGYDHYEVSSYAKTTTSQRAPSYSRHNQIYWGYDTQWYAAGLGATSFVQGKLLARPRTLFDYLAWINKTTTTTATSAHDHGDAVVHEDDEDDLDILMDIVLKRLRTKSGLNLDWVEGRFGHDYSAAVVKGAELGLELGLAVHDDHAGVLRLIDSKGFLYSNSIISSIFVEMEAVTVKRSKTCAKN